MIAPASAMMPAAYRVTARAVEAPGVVTLDLVPADSTPALAFAPGQFTMMYAFGVGEIPISISGPPADRGRLVQTVREVGAVSRAVVGAQVGQVLGVRGPYGASWPVAEAAGSDVVIVAGGLGLAPVRPILYHILDHRSAYGDVTLVYGARSPEDFLFAAELKTWVDSRDVKVFVTVDRASPAWSGHVGFVTSLIPKVRLDPRHAVAFICGPEIMMRTVAQALQARGMPPDQLFVSMERNMQCAIGLCGHCQLGPTFVCKDGPVFTMERAAPLMAVREL